MAQSQQSRSQSAKTYQLNYVIAGLILLFIHTVALLHWGFLGMMITNLYRLVVGEFYPLIMVAIISQSLYMIIKGRRPIIAWPRLLGFSLVTLSLASFLHFQRFSPYRPQGYRMISQVIDLFKDDFLTGQANQPLGGGIVGASIYTLLTPLLGFMGSYLLLVLIFLIGFCLLVGISHRDLIQATQSLGHYLRIIGQKSRTGLSHMREVFQYGAPGNTRVDDDASDHSENGSEAELNEEGYDQLTNYYREEEKKKNSTSFLNRIKSSFLRDKQASPEDLYHHRYQPAFKEDKNQEWKDYNQGVPKARTAAKRRREKDVILDMDYFDQMDSGFNTSINHQVNSSPSQLFNQHNDHQDIPISTNNHVIPTHNQTNIQDDHSKLDEDEVETNQQDDSQAQEDSRNFKPDFESPKLAASHWQDAAHTKHQVGSNDWDELLREESTCHQTLPKNKAKAGSYQLPGLDILTKRPVADQSEEYQHINHNIEKLERTFDSFNIDAKVVKANLGPAVTKYEIEPAIGVKVSKIVSLSDDIALALAAPDIRMEAPIPGKSLIGIEVPNKQVSAVSFHEVVEAGLESDKLLEVPLGRDVSGSVCLADLAKMPHLLIAGATGSGKSVGINVIIVSLLMKARPEEVKFLMIDPKQVELNLYNDIPHLLSPVVTNPRKAAQALNKVVQEMEHRYELFASVGVRNQEGYNDYVEKVNKEEGTGYQKLPKIVVIIDELADLMLVASNEVENSIIRLAQMARAAGIHMIIATQRPSVDVITGIIKANVPSRLAFAVSSGTDSRTILDSNGAEKLLGRGDMLFQPMGMNKPLRVQGAFISDDEVERVTNFIKAQREADYDENMIVSEEEMEQAEISEDEYFEEAIELIKGQETISISQLQRSFRIGYNRAARLIDDLEAIGYVSGQDGSKPRKVLIN
ncbi:DNA translocase FtsK [Hutsoniella sourekii]